MEGDYRMSKNEDTGSPGWGASSFFIQTKEDVARAVAAAAAAATLPRSPRPSVIFSSKDERSGSPLQKLQRQVNKLLNGSSPPPEVKVGNYNPEVLTSQKRQWASFQLQNLDHRHLKEPSKLFESMVVVGLHPNCDIQALERQYIARKSEGSGRLRSALSGQNQSRVEPNLEPQVLFVYPPKKQLPLKYKDLLSFCFPGGLEVHAIERTPSMSELNQVLLGQEHLKQSDMCFVFRLQVADDSTLYGCCMLVEELVQKPGGLLSMISDKRNSCSSLSRFILTTRRCYCILSRLPLFELHFGVLHSIFTEERLERLTEGIALLDSEFPENHGRERSFEENKEETSDSILVDDRITDDTLKEITEFSRPRDSAPGIVAEEQNKVEHQRTEFFHFGDSATGIVSKNQNDVEHQTPDEDIQLLKTRVCNNVVVPVDAETEMFTVTRESSTANTEEYEATEKCVPNALLPLLCYYQYESSESSYSFQDSSCEDRNFRSDIDDTEMEASFSGQDDSSDLIDILEWAKENNHGTLQIICEYYRSPCPARGSVLRFHPLEHLHPLEYHRPGETVLHIAGSTIDLSSCSTSLEYAEAHSSLFAEEEASALSTWAIACMCGSLRLENVLTLFAAALLEKQILVVCSNLGILSAIVLSTIPLIRPYQWQSLIMPVLPNDMLDFLDAPVPYIVGVKNKTSEVQSKLSNVIVIDANKNQVKSSSIPQLPQRKELYSSLSPHYARLVGESFLGKKRPVYKCSNVQVEASKGFISVLRSYVDSLCSNLRSHTITNVQSNHDKVSLLLKESFIDSYPSRDRPFMKHFVDTQLFSVHTDLVLSFFQKQ